MTVHVNSQTSLMDTAWGTEFSYIENLQRDILSTKQLNYKGQYSLVNTVPLGDIIHEGGTIYTSE